jgi:hypothetical protein
VLQEKIKVILYLIDSRICKKCARKYTIWQYGNMHYLHIPLFHMQNILINMQRMYIRCRTSSFPRPSHDITSQSINMDLFEAEIHCEARLGGANVAAHSGQIEKQPAT